MKAIELQAFGENGLRAVEQPVPRPGAGEVLLRTVAASLNYRDREIRDGRYAMPVALPLVPLSDAVAEVVELGAGVPDLQPGDRVCPVFFPDWRDGAFDARYFQRQRGGNVAGVLREYMVLPAGELVRAPRHLGAEAATLPIAGLTAWSALREAGLRPGQTLLVQGLGGVSLFALQFGRMSGARVVVVASGAEKAQRARELGADDAIDQAAHPQWGAQVLERTEGRGADLIVEVGGRASWHQSIAALAVNGTIAVVGYASGAELAFDLRHLFIAKRARLQGHTVGSRRAFEDMVRAMEQARTEPVVDSRFALDDTPQAYARLACGRTLGKVLVELR
ncbi:MAG: NAD(P)-dependent alcohol dehydrogenase [Pseudomonadota bacterium]